MFKKKLFVISMILLLIFSFFPSFTTDQVNATATPPKRVLEIVDIGGTQLILPSSEYLVETIRMKRFVALREELDGKYDAIVISKGTYSSAQVGSYTDRSLAHDTRDKQNDITNLKAKEIIENFVNKNQLVIIHNDAIQTNNLIKSYFKIYASIPTSSVKFVSDMKNVSTVMSSFFNNNKNRPRINLTESPISYPGNKEYQAGEKVTFKFNVNANNTNNLTANLYIDANFNHRYEPVELIQSASINGTSGTIEYILPRGHSGLRYWKLEIVDGSSNLKDYKTGVIKFKGEKVNIKVLQVTSGDNDNSRLTREVNMKSSYLSTNDYHIQINTVGMLNFTDSTHQYSHTKLNGNYDMLIFGFNDSYNGNATLTPNAAQSVQRFIQTGQSVMFTHDTIFNQNNIWVNNFMEPTGQKNPWTNLGFGAPQQSTSTKKINEGLLTQFPFSLGENITIANTHNQYYTLDVEDIDVIPWYNIIGGHRDNDDSWNHYYTYSKGNITYSGTGHTNNTFPDQEQKLFVNTMFRAFLGANTAPVINVFSPTNGRNHLKNQDLELVFEAYDLDLTDRQLKTRVFVNTSTNPVYTNDVANGAVVRTTLGQEYLRVGQNTIRVELEDTSGANSFKEIKINVQEAQFNVNKTVSKSKANVDEPVNVKYTISVNSPGMIDNSPVTNGKVFPYAIERSEVSTTRIQLADENRQGNFGWIESNDGSGASRLRAMILADERLDVVVNQLITTQPGNMNMTETVKQWLNGKTKTVNIPIVDTFPNGRKENPVKAIGVYQIFEENSNVYLKYVREATASDNIFLSGIKIEDFIPNGVQIVSQHSNMTKQTNATGTNVQIDFDGISLRQLSEKPIEVEYTIKSSQPGVYVMDRSAFKYKIGNNTETTLPFNTITLEVVQPVTGVQIRSTSTDLIVGENSRRLFFDIVPENATNKNGAINSAKWTSSDSSIVTVDKDGFITAHKKGKATITVTVDDVDNVNNGQPFTNSIVIDAIVPLDGIVIEGTSELFVDDEQLFTIGTIPSGVDITNKNVTWTIKQGNNIIDLTANGNVTAKQPGTAVIEATIIFRGESLKAEKLINVKQFKIDPATVDVNIGSTTALTARVYSSATASEAASGVTWSSSNTNVATVNNSGVVTGIADGTAVITARLNLGNAERVAQATVTVKEIPLQSINANTSTIYVQKGNTKDILVTFIPSNATFKQVTYSVNRPDFVSVEPNGRVTGREVRYGLVNGKMEIVPAATVTIQSVKYPLIKTTVDIVVVETGSEENENGRTPGNNNGQGPTIGGNRW